MIDSVQSVSFVSNIPGGCHMLLNPQFFAEQVLNSLQFSMLLFLLAIGLSVVFGLMDYLNLSHGTHDSRGHTKH